MDQSTWEQCEGRNELAFVQRNWMSALGTSLTFISPPPSPSSEGRRHINVTVVGALLASMLIAFVGSLPLPSSPLLCSPPPSHCPPPLLCSPLVWDPQSFSPTIFASLAVRPSVRPKCIHSSSNNCRCHPLTGRTDTRAPHLIPEFRSKGTGANHLAEEERGRCGDRERRGEERRGGRRLN